MTCCDIELGAHASFSIGPEFLNVFFSYCEKYLWQFRSWGPTLLNSDKDVGWPPPPLSPLLCQQFLSYWDHFIIHIHFHCRETDLNANFFVVWSIYIIWLLYKFKILTFIQISQYPIFKDYGAWTGSNIRTLWLSWLKSKCPQITFF